MKKLGKLSLNQLDEQLPKLSPRQMIGYVGGSDTPDNLGGAEYYGLYGVHLPYDCYYNPETDQLCQLGLTSNDPGTISPTQEDAYSQACALGYEAAFRFYIGLGIAVADVYLLFTSMPGIGPDVSDLGTWSQDDINPSDEYWN